MTTEPRAVDGWTKAPGGMPPPVVELRSISKKFGTVSAVADVSLIVRSGEIHMLVGHNGAGKSTLVKILGGALRPDSGNIFFEGRPVSIRSPADARRIGIAVVAQDFSLVPDLTVAQNIFLGREPRSRVPGLIDMRRLRREASVLLAKSGLALHPDAYVGNLGVAQRQLVEIAKALSQDAKVLVLDEPTAALTGPECECLFDAVRRLRGEGRALIYISHKLDEVFALGDDITLLRDGRRVVTRPVNRTSREALVRAMFGRSAVRSASPHSRPEGEPVLELRDVCAANGIRNITLSIRRGEFVGLGGLVGSGRTEVARTIIGADHLLSGEIFIGGRQLRGGPDEAVRLGAALVPENRKSEGLALVRSVRENLVMAGLSRLFPDGIYRTRISEGAARGQIKDLAIRTPRSTQAAALLSGGNQQKLVLGKWLVAGSRVLIIDEPTRGLDISARREVFAILQRLARDGVAILMISSEADEIADNCHRAYIMQGKRLAWEIGRGELTSHTISRLSAST